VINTRDPSCRTTTLTLSLRATLPIAAAAAALGSLALEHSAHAQWVTFANETATRMPVGPGLNTAATSTSDAREKDYAWGDIDQDGDIDLICVRKQPFTSPGRDPNILFMNEGIAEGHAINGVLVDRTAQYASATLETETWDDPQRPGGALPDEGFLTWTNDRDVVLADFDNDGWLDLVTATTISDGAPKWIGHPRIYMNLGENKGGDWLGFRYEPDRIPAMVSASGAAGLNPRFCSVAAGDVTGDGYPDLYFGDYDSSGAGGSGEPAGIDFNNKFLINQGASNPGFFTDTLTSRISAAKLVSAFGAASVIADMNNDGAIDIVKQTSLQAPTHVAIHHNNPGNVGFFPDATYKNVDTAAPYFASTGDLNNDGRLDLVVTDDGLDKYYLNTGNAGDGTANFTSFSFGAPSSGFGSQSVPTDLNNDGWNDVLISDVDVDINDCGGGRLNIYRNLGNAPNVTIQEQPLGGGLVAPSTFNVAVFDIDGDGWKDLVIGHCSGTVVWRQVPPSGLSFSYPEGLPAYLTPEQTTTFEVQLTGISGAQIVPNSGKIYYSVDGAPFTQANMTPLGGNLYSATLPAAECTSRVQFYFSGDLVSGGTQYDPTNAPTTSYLAVAATGTEISLEDTIEGSTASWSISNGAGLTAGTWQQATPNPTFFNSQLAAPAVDNTNGEANTQAFVTFNGPEGDFSAGSYDVDGGATMLVTPTIDLANADATISYSRWFYASLSGNFLKTEVSNNNGGTWVQVDNVTTTIAGEDATVWQEHAFVVGQYVAPTAQVKVRFTASGTNANAIVEAGIDNLRVEKILCGATCAADTNGSGAVDVDDLVAVILGWGPCGATCDADVNDSGAVDVDDLVAVILAWGACP
jgi:hypothetical protein